MSSNDSPNLKRAKQLYDIIYNARRNEAVVNNLRLTTPPRKAKVFGTQLADMIIRRAAAEQALLALAKSLTRDEKIALHGYGRQKHGLTDY